ncbi:fungal-specific transcription factor domain-containing protein [Fusarium tricinctum]|uniref:Fungal-specific transcription factor domain-containing protein n=1 Tax=Fusarium tricinctum TaxID=61284 RepID=A0A8K0RM22_9HYPO|nr:fungal-specific transcription factor domain-containing protein [Fusarium tricinctum]
MPSHESQVVSSQTLTLQTIVQPRPQRQISFLPPLAQYLFQFYTLETMRLTVPSDCAKTEICRFLIPMSFHEPSLLYAIMAFAAVHLDAIGKLPGDSQRLIDSLHWASIRQLRRLLEDLDPVSQAVALATTRTLCQAQIYGGTSLWRVHLNGARAILESTHERNKTIKGSDQPVHADFLSSWFNNAQALAALNPIGPFEDHIRLSSQPQREVFFDIYGGVMSDLPALFSEVGALVQKSRKQTSGASGGTGISDFDIELEADILTREIHTRLTRDKADNIVFSYHSLLSLSANDIQNYALSNAGFLYTALLHIYYGARSLSPHSVEVQFCVSQIINCAYGMSCETGLSPRVLLVAPLFTAGLCATGPARDSIRSSLVDIGKWMKTPHLLKTLELLEDIWERYPSDGRLVETWKRLETVKLDFLPY